MVENIEVIDSRKTRKKRSDWQTQPGSATQFHAFAMMAADCVRKYNGRSMFSDDESGLALFKRLTIEYIEEVDRYNSSVESKRDLLPLTIEGLCGYLKISRMTLLRLEKNYSPEFSEFIRLTKDQILLSKQVMAVNGSYPPVLLIFDSVNNAGYRSVDKFQLSDTENRPDAINRKEIEVRYLSVIGDSTDIAEDELPFG